MESGRVSLKETGGVYFTVGQRRWCVREVDGLTKRSVGRFTQLYPRRVESKLTLFMLRIVVSLTLWVGTTGCGIPLKIFLDTLLSRYWVGIVLVCFHSLSQNPLRNRRDIPCPHIDMTLRRNARLEVGITASLGTWRTSDLHRQRTDSLESTGIRRPMSVDETLV